MVVFTCNHCGDSLQKPKVAKHYQFQCRNPIFVTCVDCHTDFRENEYVAHTKCITENERYGGKDYVSKGSSNKGEKKQQAWIDVVQNVLCTSTNLTAPERNLLNNISRHENIPRKKAKFFNFIKSLSGNKANMTIVENVWNKMEKAFKESTVTNGNNNGTDKTDKQNLTTEENQNNSNISKDNENEENSNVVNEIKELESSKKKKKSKKRPHETSENGNDEPVHKKVTEIEEINTHPAESITENNNDDKFSWKSKILEIVTAKGEVSLKKLRKKVVAQYLENFPNGSSEKAISKFDKKLSKVSDILITENIVKLVKC